MVSQHQNNKFKNKKLSKKFNSNNKHKSKRKEEMYNLKKKSRKKKLQSRIINDISLSYHSI